MERSSRRLRQGAQPEDASLLVDVVRLELAA
eukprot:CAMPEP_0195083644 /NCGR_PEP_ID=MMETSP0448-20130528/24527_1 /TAXON_ID=66468 /ORGANISM="Heterocapsa triquestra, Strain CCMP 448" /LENGTH=30 /DNA_ID= /DNA_START= /DNA_END= /DNA_ORIENTATION=